MGVEASGRKKHSEGAVAVIAARFGYRHGRHGSINPLWACQPHFQMSIGPSRK